MLRLLPFLIAALSASLTASAAAATDPAAFETARALVAEKKFPEAQQAFEKLAATNPKDAEVNFQLGELALRRNEFEKAAAYFEKAAAAEPKASRHQRRLGDAYGSAAQKASVFSQLGLAKKCLAAYQRATALDPNDLDAHSALFEYYRQAPGFVGGGIDKATAEANAIKKLDAHRGRLAFATLYIGEKKFDLALAEFDEVLKADPDNYSALYQVGRFAAMTGQYVERGITSLRRCLELTPPAAPNTPGHAAAQWRLGNLLEKKKDPAGARAAYEAALQLDPAFAPAAESLKKMK